jgi:hypothetical protein
MPSCNYDTYTYTTETLLQTHDDFKLYIFGTMSSCSIKNIDLRQSNDMKYHKNKKEKKKRIEFGPFISQNNLNSTKTTVRKILVCVHHRSTANYLTKNMGSVHFNQRFTIILNTCSDIAKSI